MDLMHTATLEQRDLGGDNPAGDEHRVFFYEPGDGPGTVPVATALAMPGPVWIGLGRPTKIDVTVVATDQIGN